MPTFGRPTNAIAAGSSVGGLDGDRGVPAGGRRRLVARPSAAVLVALVVGLAASPTTNGSSRPAATSFAHASASSSRVLRASLGVRSRAEAPRRSRRAGRPCRGRARPRSGTSPPSRATGTRPRPARAAVLSALLTATITGAVAVRSSSAASWSAGVMPLDRVDDEQDDVGLADREPGLLLDPRLDRVVRCRPRARRCRRPRTAGRSTPRRRTAGRASSGRGPRRSPGARRRSG